MSKTIGIGIIGTGFGQIIHIPGFQTHSQTAVVGVCNRSLAKAQQVAEKFNIAFACDRYADLIAHPSVDAVAISTPPFLHYEAAKAAIAAGKHVLLEKPTTINVAEALELYHLAKQRNVVVALDFEFRFIPTWRYLHDLLQQNHIGKKRLITIDWLVQGRADPKRAWNWYSQKSQGGGALGAIGSHVFDYIDWLFSPVKRLSGQLSTGIAERPTPEGEMRRVDADDTCNLLLELADGTPCNVRLSTVTYRGRGHWVTVYGELGTLVLGNPNQADYIHGFSLQQAKLPKTELEVLSIPTEYELPQVYTDGRLAPFIAVCDRFVQAINQGIPMIPGIAEGVYSQLLMDLTHQSHEQGKWIDVPSRQSLLS